MCCLFVTGTQITLPGLLQSVPAFLCGVAIAWCGINVVGRIVATAVLAVKAVPRRRRLPVAEA